MSDSRALPNINDYEKNILSCDQNQRFSIGDTDYSS
jgi:hypothetical protein